MYLTIAIQLDSDADDSKYSLLSGKRLINAVIGEVIRTYQASRTISRKNDKALRLSVRFGFLRSS